MDDRPRPIRVLRIIARLNVGGPARHAAILDDGLRDRGYQTLLVYGSLSPGEGSLEELVKTRDLPSENVPELGRSIWPGQDLRAFVKILAVLRRWSPDIVHTHTSKAGTLGRLAVLAYNVGRRRADRIIAVHTFHGHVFAGYFGRVGSSLARTTERSLARITDRIVTISESQRRDITDTFGIAPRSKVEVVPLGLELDHLLARPMRPVARLSTGPDAGPVTIGFVGRLVPIKDVETLLRAVALARVEMPQLRLVVAGDGESRETLEALARSLGLGDVVRFDGWRKDLAALYASMDLFVLTSINEGTPVSLIEAMAAGVPVVATAVGGVPDVVSDGRTGRLVPARDPVAVAAAILSALTDVEKTVAMVGEARDAVRERFGAARLVDEVDGLYRQLLGRVRTSAANRSSTA